MKVFFSAVLSLVGAAQMATAAQSLLITSGSINYVDPVPPIDAVAWLNLGTFRVDTLDPYQPFTATSLRNFTNQGSMFGYPGYRFLTYTVNQNSSSQAPMSWFVNHGTIAVSDRLSVVAENIVSRGRLMCNEQGFIILNATNAGGRLDIRNAGLQAGGAGNFDATLTPLYLGLNNSGTLAGTYNNDFDVLDYWWGAGNNHRITTNQTQWLYQDTLAYYFSGYYSGLGLGGLGFGWWTPTFDVQEVGTLGTPLQTSESLPQLCDIGFNQLGIKNFQAFVLTNRWNPSNEIIHVVYVATNSPYTNLTVDFYPAFIAGGDDTLWGRGWTNTFYFTWHDTNIVDSTPVRSTFALDVGTPHQNGGLALNRNADAATRRPAVVQLYRYPYTFFGGGYFGLQPNTNAFALDFWSHPGPLSILNPIVDVTNRVNTTYLTYSAQIAPGLTYAPRPNPLINDPTNFPGKVMLSSTSLNDDGTRIRAENFVAVQTKNLEDGTVAQIDAPVVDLDLGVSNRTLVVSNALPRQVIRFFGNISVYTISWTNQVFVLSPNPTNATQYITNRHTQYYNVMMVDNCLRPPDVQLNRFNAKAGHLRVEDTLSIVNSTLIDAQSMTVGPQGALTFPVNSSWGVTNVPRVNSLTNFGRIVVPRDAVFASSSGPYEYLVNHGDIVAGSVTARASYFENTGSEFNPAVIGGFNGHVLLDVNTGVLDHGYVTNGYSLEIRAENLEVRSTWLSAGMTNDGTGLPLSGNLMLAVTDRLSDGSYFSTNDNAWHVFPNTWEVTGGAQLSPRPASGDLYGTTLRATLVPYADATFIWPARNVGPVLPGYTNNLALGRLVLDGALWNRFNFSGPDSSGSYALYVDYLELRGDATNYTRLAPKPVFDIAPNFTLYFADASLPPKKLDGAANGRLRWVHNMAGPSSGTNFVYVRTNSYGVVTTNYYLFNQAVVNDVDLDSDYDGIVNAEDASPIFTPADIDLVVTYQNLGTPPTPRAVLTWTALAHATNTVEYTTDVSSPTPAWRVLTSFVQGPATERVTRQDPAPAEPARLYRVREDPLWPPQ